MIDFEVQPGKFYLLHDEYTLTWQPEFRNFTGFVWSKLNVSIYSIPFSFVRIEWRLLVSIREHTLPCDIFWPRYKRINPNRVGHKSCFDENRWSSNQIPRVAQWQHRTYWDTTHLTNLEHTFGCGYLFGSVSWSWNAKSAKMETLVMSVVSIRS